MIEVKHDIKEGFSTQFTFEGWKVAYITYSSQYDEMKIVKRHNLSDEVFLLLKGSASLFTCDRQIPDNFIETNLEKEKMYNVTKGTWHHLKVSKDALLTVVENSNTTKDNTDVFEL